MPVARLRLVLAAGTLSAAVAGFTTAASASSGDQVPSPALLNPTSGSDTTFTWSYGFHENGGNVPSKLAIAFCDEEIVDHAELASQSWSRLDEGQGGHDGTAVTGEFSITFDQAYEIDPAGLLLRSHDGITTAPGPGPCPEPR